MKPAPGPKVELNPFFSFVSWLSLGVCLFMEIKRYKSHTRNWKFM